MTPEQRAAALRWISILEHEANSHGATDYKHNVAALLRELAQEPQSKCAALTQPEQEPPDGELMSLIEKLQRRYGLSFLGEEKRLRHFARDWLFLTTPDTSSPPQRQPLTEQEPVAWLVIDKKGTLMHAAGWRDAAHEHINDAINEYDLVEAKHWRVIPAYGVRSDT